MSTRIRITCKVKPGDIPSGADVDVSVSTEDGKSFPLPLSAIRIHADCSGQPLRAELELSDVELDLDLPADVISRLAPQEPEA